MQTLLIVDCSGLNGVDKKETTYMTGVVKVNGEAFDVSTDDRAMPRSAEVERAITAILGGKGYDFTDVVEGVMNDSIAMYEDDEEMLLEDLSMTAVFPKWQIELALEGNKLVVVKNEMVK